MKSSVGAGNGGIIIVEGPVGVGKSTLCEELAKHPNVVVHEELDEFMTDAVEKYYAGEVSPFETQLAILEHRKKRYLEAQNNLQGKWHVFDRSLWGDFALAAANLYDAPVQWAAFKAEFTRAAEAVRLPDLQVYLDASAQKCLKRILYRERACEMERFKTSEGFAYLTRMVAVCRNWHLQTLAQCVTVFPIYEKMPQGFGSLAKSILKSAAKASRTHLTKGVTSDIAKQLADLSQESRRIADETRARMGRLAAAWADVYGFLPGAGRIHAYTFMRHLADSALVSAEHISEAAEFAEAEATGSRWKMKGG